MTAPKAHTHCLATHACLALAFATCHCRANPPQHESYGKSQIPPCLDGTIAGNARKQIEAKTGKRIMNKLKAGRL